MRTILIGLLVNGLFTQAQLTTPPIGGNKKDSVFEQIGLTTVTIHYDQRNQDAYAVFKTNYDKNPNQFTTNLGTSRALIALSKSKDALPYLQAALPDTSSPGRNIPTPWPNSDRFSEI